jgi:hypothetical protein
MGKEEDRIKGMECWSNGVMELGLNQYSSTPMLHYSEVLGTTDN